MQKVHKMNHWERGIDNKQEKISKWRGFFSLNSTKKKKKR